MSVAIDVVICANAFVQKFAERDQFRAALQGSLVAEFELLLVAYSGRAYRHAVPPAR
jgi:hypothetical protein